MSVKLWKMDVKRFYSEPLWICCTRRREAKLVDFPYYIFKAADIYVIELRQVQANYVRTNISLGLFSAWLRGRDWLRQVSLCLHSVLLIEPLLTQGIFFFAFLLPQCSDFLQRMMTNATHWVSVIGWYTILHLQDCR